MLPKRTKLNQRHQALLTERSSWDSHWKELGQYVLPRGTRFTASERNQGGKKNQSIYDATATHAVNVTTAGLMSAASSPSRTWFTLEAPAPELNEVHAVQVWLDEVTDLIENVFRRSNTYRALHQIYQDVLVFGTACSVVVPDARDVIHHHVLPIGEYCLAQDYAGRVNTLYREFDRTVAEVVREFGIENVSHHVKSLYNSGALDATITVVHVIEPRDDRDPSKADPLEMPWSSVYYEKNGSSDQILRESGFLNFPVLAPRWTVTAGDVYGRSAAMDALPDVKGLQHKQLRYAQAVDYQTRPPIMLPASAAGRETNTLPGGINYVDGLSGTTASRSMWEVNLNLNYLRESIEDDRRRIRSALHSDTFLMLSSGTDHRMTATEVAERREEKLLILGPVIERLDTELLEPLVNLTFDQLLARGELPPAPEELAGADLRVVFVSMLAQAQRAVGVNAVDRAVGHLGVLAQMKPEVLDRFDADASFAEYADMLGLDAKLIVPMDQVEELRAARAQAQAAKEQAAMAEQAAGAMNQAAGAAAQAGRAGSDILNLFSGYQSPAGTEV